MTLANREKVVIGIITLILAIAALHLFIFSPKARQLSDAKKNWNGALGLYNRMASAQSPSDLKRYEGQTKEYDEQFTQLALALNLVAQGYYVDAKPESLEKRREDFINVIEKLLVVREEKDALKLSFLAEEGWDLPDSLPENIEMRRVNLWDLISKLDSIHSILDVIVNQTVKETKEEERRLLLLQLGFDQWKVASLARYGDHVPLIKRLVHAQLILGKKPEEYRLTKEKLYGLLRIEFPDNLLLYLNKQLDAVIDLVEMARENKIGEISMVRLLPKSEVFREPEQTSEPGSGAPMAPVVPARAPRFVDANQFAGAAVAGEGGGPMPLVQATPAPPARKLICVITPVQLRFSATNLNAMKFLYEISHSQRTYEIEDLAIQALEGSTVEVFVTINVTAYVDGVSLVVQPAA